MSYESLIVAYDTSSRADAAVRALRQIGVPRGDKKRHPVSGASLEEVAAAPGPPTGSGFFGWLFGSDAVDARVELYKKALASGGTIISVQVLSDERDRVHHVLQDFGPLDLEVASGGN
jgi:hypothetical protein